MNPWRLNAFNVTHHHGARLRRVPRSEYTTEFSSPTGRNDYGQTAVPPDAFGVSAIAAGAAFSIALRDDGKLVSWGRAPTGSPRHLPDGGARLSAGESHCLALAGDGILHAWGDNTYEQCAVPYGLGGVLAISAGGVFSLALIAQMHER